MTRLRHPAAFLAVVVFTNLITAQLGVVDWLGISATAGTWLAGFAFVARDATQEGLTFGPDVNLPKLLAWQREPLIGSAS